MSYEASFRSALEELRRQHRRRELALPTAGGFVDNDYLGLSRHPRLIDAGKRALEAFGAGHRGSRLLGGHSELFEEVEARLARFFGAPAALFFSTGYLANLAVVQAVASHVEAVVCDEKIHASLIDAVRLTRLPKTILPHNQWDEAPKTPGKKLFVAESLYSMDGDFARLAALKQAARDGGAFVILDEAHAAGVFGEKGAGLFSAGGGDWERTAVVVTFGKAFGVAGAAVLSTPTLREWLVNQARSFIYTTAPAPAIVAMVGEATSVLEQEGWRREELWARAREAREILRRRAGVRFPSSGSDWDDASPILPVLVPGDDKALLFCETMRKKGISLRAIRYPTVPRGAERVRVSLTLNVSRDATRAMAEGIAEVLAAHSAGWT